MRGRLLLAAALAIVAGCEGDAEIVASCVAETGPVEVGLGVDERFLAVGVMDDHVLVMGDRPAPIVGEWPVETRAYFVQWLGPDLRPVGERIELGWNTWTFYATRWVRVGDALEGLVIAEPEPTDTPTIDKDMVHTWRVPRPDLGAPTHTRIAISVPTPEPGFASVWFNGVHHTLTSHLAPAAVVADEARFAVVSVPAPCTFVGKSRIFEVARGRSSMLSWGSDECVPPSLDSAENPWLVDLGDEEYGILYRPEALTRGHVHWVRVGADRSIRGAPMRVGDIAPYSTGFGSQPRGIHLDGRVLFTERDPIDDTCHHLRVFEADGSNARQAPWQMPCVADSCRIDQYPELLDAGTVGALVYADVPSAWCGAGAPAQLVLQAMTRNGRRGSEPQRLDDPDEPTTGYVRAASDGPSIVVAWPTSRGRTMVRRARCEEGMR